MSDSVYSFASTFCCVLLICSLIRLISPTKSTSKTLSLIIGVFMLLSVMTPLISFFLDFEYDEIQTSVSDIEDEINADVDEKVIEKTGDYLTEYIAKILESSEVGFSSIEAIMSCDDDSGIYVDGVNIYIEQADNAMKEKIRESVLTAVGVEPTVIVKQDN